MTVTDSQAGTNVHEVSDGIYRINTPVQTPEGGFSFNQYLIVGFLAEERTHTLLCGDLFTQPGAGQPPVTEADILEPSEAFRHELDYFSHTKSARTLTERLAATGPTTLACMHGSAWRGDGAALLRALAAALSA